MIIHRVDDQPEEPHRNEHKDTFDEDDAITVAGKFPAKHIDKENERSFLVPYVSIGHTTLGPHLADKLEEILIGHQA